MAGRGDVTVAEAVSGATVRRLVDVAARVLLCGPIPHDGPAGCLAVRSDGEELAMGSGDG